MARYLQVVLLTIWATGLAWGGETPLMDLAKVQFPETERTEAGIAFRFDMGNRRCNWTNSRWSMVELPQPVDLSAVGGLRLSVSTKRPRRDAGVYVALREADGSWYYHAWACDLVQAETTRVIKLDDFRITEWVSPPTGGHQDENQIFDRQAVQAVAIGCVNPFGIGELTFTLRSLDLVPAVAREEGPVPVKVSGKTLDINGTTTIPGGLFGDFPDAAKPDMRTGSHRSFDAYLKAEPHRHATDPAVAMMIQIVGGDRYQASGRMTDPEWQANYRNLGRSLGQRLLEIHKKSAKPVVIEFWNEPYLNWANRSRIAFSQRFFDVSQAREGGPVHLAMDGSVCPFLRWTRDYEAPNFKWLNRNQWRGAKDDKGQVVGGVEPPPDTVKDGEPYLPAWKDVKDPVTDKISRVQDGQHQVFAYTPWYVYDETQFTFWSGQGQLRHYNEPMLVLARALKQVDPQATFIAGWDFRPGEDHWAGFNLLYKPTIDVGIEFIDGICDHDYGGDVTRLPANYEVVTAYGMALHNKWLYHYNTECGENSDPSAYPDANKSMNEQNKRWLKVLWCSRKILSTLALSSDKARTATFHWFDHQAEGLVFYALRNLRGKLVQVDCGDPRLLAVSAIDGTDPLQPRPDYVGPGKELVTAVFNDDCRPRSIDLDLTAPQGTTFTKAVLRRAVNDFQPGQDLDKTVNLLVEEQPAKGTSHHFQAIIPAKTFISLSLALDGNEPDKPEVLRRQFFANRVLRNVGLDKAGKPAPITLNLQIPQTELAAAKRVWLRFVSETLAEGEGVLQLNEQRLILPGCPTPSNVCWIREVPLQAAWLKPDNTLQFSVADSSYAGYLLGMASVFIEH